MKPRRTALPISVGILALVALVVAVASLVKVSTLNKRFEPYIRKEAVSWLEKRFDSQVELSSLHLRIPPSSPLHLLLTGGRGTLARVNGSGLTIRRKNTGDVYPVLTIRNFSFDVDLGAVLDSPKSIRQVVVDGMDITVPPKGQANGQPTPAAGREAPNVEIREITAKDSRLVIMPKTGGKPTLKFDIAWLRLDSKGKGLPMDYDARLTNPKPQGFIQSNGTFGPWNETEPGDTPLSGHYTFDHADLSSFSAIAGILNSTGEFEGTLSAITAKGKAFVPDFRLKSAGHPVSLAADFEALVDGENGNTILKPVRATLGSTRFTTSGAVIRKNGELQRSIALDVSMPAGNLSDVLRLAMPGPLFMEGDLAFSGKIVIPPLATRVNQKLLLDGQFRISSGQFLRSAMQSKIDSLSRRGQGQPNNKEITQVFSQMTGSFHMENRTIAFRSLRFATPGAGIELAGTYNLADERLDFHGSLGLQAKISQTVAGWKRWVLKPIDPFFAKNGVGTYLRIKITGNSKSPDFGLDYGKPDSAAE